MSCGRGSRPGSGWWICVDRTAFAAGHVPGTFNFGIDGAFATYVGWLIDWGTPITLLGRTEAEVQQAQRELVRIGIDRPAAAATGTPQRWTTKPLGAFPQATFADLDAVRHHRTVVILDVRRAAEFAAARIEGAVNIPIHELPRRVHEVPDAEIWVHCAGGLPRLDRRLVPRRRRSRLGRRRRQLRQRQEDRAAPGVPLTAPRRRRRPA